MNRTESIQDKEPSFPVTDPYLAWHWDTGFRFLPAGTQWIPLLVKLTKDTSRREFIFGRWVEQPPFADGLSVSLLEVKNELQDKSRYVIAYVRPGATFAVLSHSEWRKRVSTLSFGQPLPPKPSTPLQGLPTAQQSASQPRRAPPPKVVTAVIDDGIAFANQCFVDTAGDTRIRKFWNLNSNTPTSAGLTLDRAQIHDLTNQNRFGSSVDEDAIYRGPELDDYSTSDHKQIARRLTHGTHMTHLATALESPAFPGGSDRPILAVQLPRTIVSDPSGTNLAPYIYLALELIETEMQTLEKNGARPPLVINISYGMSGGPHDGSHPIEEAIDEYIRLRRTAGHQVYVVIAAGNFRLERGHATLRPGRALPWEVLPDDRTPSALEIWLPVKPLGCRVKVRVVDPIGNATAWVNEGAQYPMPVPNVPAPCSIYYTEPPTTSGRRRILIRLLPTAAAEALTAQPTARFGTWTVEIAKDGASSPDVDLYVQRDDTPLGYKQMGRQSFLDDPSYKRLDRAGRVIEWDHEHGPSLVTRIGTMNAIATGAEIIAVAGARRRDRSSPRYSSLGFSPPGRQPNLAAYCEDSFVLRGVLAAGTRSGSTLALNGTSVAAAQVTRWIANFLYTAAAPVPPATLMATLKPILKVPNVPSQVKRLAAGHGVLDQPSIPEFLFPRIRRL